MHTHDAIAEGVSAERLMMVSVWREAGNYFSARERAALEWAEAVTWVAGDQVPDEAFLVARAEFSDKELADLTLAIGLMNVYNRMAISFRRPPASLVTLESIA
jgi:alkylhydroperoxidase family enzyme